MHASGREIDYRQEPVIFHVRDSGELVDPNRQQPYPQSEVNAEERVDSARLEGSWYDPHYAQPARRPYQGMMVSQVPSCVSPFLWIENARPGLGMWMNGCGHSLGTCKRITFHSGDKSK